MSPRQRWTGHPGCAGWVAAGRETVVSGCADRMPNGGDGAAAKKVGRGAGQAVAHQLNLATRGQDREDALVVRESLRLLSPLTSPRVPPPCIHDDSLQSRGDCRAILVPPMEVTTV